jgi:hypothetical protein
MLKVSVTEQNPGVSLGVEGRLAGPWVPALEECWRNQRVQLAQSICVRLNGVSFIDEAGKDLLARMFRDGAKLEGSGCLVRAILAKIVGQKSAT